MKVKDQTVIPSLTLVSYTFILCGIEIVKTASRNIAGAQGSSFQIYYQGGLFGKKLEKEHE